MRVFVATKARVAMAKQDSDIEGLPLLDVVIGLLEESVKEGHGR